MDENLKEVIERTIKEWAPMMRIADWDIEFRFVNARELREALEGKEGTVAYCRRNRLLKYATIEIDEDHKEVKKDWQLVLAHEMFHIVTDEFHYHASCLLDFVAEDAYKTFENQLDMYYERLVEDLAKAFVAALRKSPNSTDAR